MKRTATIIFLLLVSCVLWSACKSSETTMDDGGSPQAAEMSVEDDLVAQSIAARGGLDQIRALQSMTWIGNVQTMGMTLPLTIYMKRPGMMRSEVEIPNMSMEVISGFDGETAWMINPMMGGGTPQKLPDEQAQLSRDQANMDGLLVGYRDRGYTLEYMGQEDVRGKAAHKLKVMRPERSDVLVYLDAETHLEVKTEGEGTNPQTGATTTIATYPSDYRAVEGVLIPFALEIEMGGQTFQTLTLTSVRANTEVDDAIFAFPGQ